MTKLAIIVPTNRGVEEWLEAWLPKLSVLTCDWKAYIIEDRPSKTLPLIPSSNLAHYCWEDIDKHLGHRSWIISHRDSGIRSFGTIMACRDGADILLHMDDDCLPWEGSGSVDTGSIGTHVNVLTQGIPCYYSPIENLRLRGQPYQNTGRVYPAINLGMWYGTPDVDGATQLAGYNTNYVLPKETRIVPPRMYIPLSGMNLAFSSWAAVLLYYPLMGEGQPYRRFDDIWGGIVAKKLCDVSGMYVAYGPPHIFHSRASNATLNEIKERPGILPNEHYWEFIHTLDISQNHPHNMVYELGAQISCASPPKGMDSDYWYKLGKAYQTWAIIFEEMGN